MVDDPLQVDVIKKAYLQEEECENAEVSPREVGHNIYILALQVPSLWMFHCCTYRCCKAGFQLLCPTLWGPLFISWHVEILPGSPPFIYIFSQDKPRKIQLCWDICEVSVWINKQKTCLSPSKRNWALVSDLPSPAPVLGP